MTKRVFNFNPVRRSTARGSRTGTGRNARLQRHRYVVMEVSHRSKEFEAVIQTAEADLRELLSIPANYKVLFLQGGHHTIRNAAYESTCYRCFSRLHRDSSWSKTALKESQKLGSARIAASTEADGFKSLPEKLDLDPNAAYLHFTSNETIHGGIFY